MNASVSLFSLVLVISDQNRYSFGVKLWPYFVKKLLGDNRSLQYSSYRVISIATAFGPPNFQMKITHLHMDENAEK